MYTINFQPMTVTTLIIRMNSIDIETALYPTNRLELINS